MADKLLPLSIPPGIYRNGTKYQSRGRWYDSQLVRFTEGTIQPVGGWRFARKEDGTNLESLNGKARAAIAWRTDSGDPIIVIATNTKLYGFAGGVLYDITPAGYVVGDVDTAPVTGNGNYNVGSYNSGAYGIGSSAASLNEADMWHLDTFGEWLVAASTSDNKLYSWDANFANIAVEPSAAGVGTVAATAGAATFSTSQAGKIQDGSRIVVAGTTYTVSAFDGTTGCTLSGAPTFAASAFDIKSGPATVSGVVVTPERFVVALGADGNVRRVAWPSQESTTDWVPTSLNTAGNFDIQTEGRLVCGRRTKAETLLWTDSDLHSMQYIGGQLVYRFEQKGEKCGIISPHAAVTYDTLALWMGNRNFFIYDGTVKPIPCPVRDFIFGDFNDTQSRKVWSMTVSEYGEAWWFYPSATSTECDRYVVYNYREGHWTVGRLRRAAGFDAGAYELPVMIAPSGEVFEHEVLFASRPAVAGEIGGFQILTEEGGSLLLEAGGGVLTESLQPYLESGPIEIGDGDRLMSVQRLIPDERTRGQVFARFYASRYPTAEETLHGPYAMREPTSVRFKARQCRIRLDENGLSDWRVGVIRLGVREGERR